MLPTGIPYSPILLWISLRGPTTELTDFLPCQWARSDRLAGQKVRSNDWFAQRSGAGQSGDLTQSVNSVVRTAKRCERADQRPLGQVIVESAMTNGPSGPLDLLVRRRRLLFIAFTKELLKKFLCLVKTFFSYRNRF